MVYTIREIAPRDNRDVEGVIRSCLIEFGWNREGTAWCDPDLGRFSEVYNREGFRYWVVADGADRAVGGAGSPDPETAASRARAPLRPAL